MLKHSARFKALNLAINIGIGYIAICTCNVSAIIQVFNTLKFLLFNPTYQTTYLCQIFLSVIQVRIEPL
jgi:hypothetical protein